MGQGDGPGAHPFVKTDRFHPSLLVQSLPVGVGQRQLPLFIDLENSGERNNIKMLQPFFIIGVPGDNGGADVINGNGPLAVAPREGKTIRNIHGEARGLQTKQELRKGGSPRALSLCGCGGVFRKIVTGHRLEGKGDVFNSFWTALQKGIQFKTPYQVSCSKSVNVIHPGVIGNGQCGGQSARHVALFPRGFKAVLKGDQGVLNPKPRVIAVWVSNVMLIQILSEREGEGFRESVRSHGKQPAHTIRAHDKTVDVFQTGVEGKRLFGFFCQRIFFINEIGGCPAHGIDL